MSATVASGEAVIRTPDQRLRVFVSSTLAELADERAAVRGAIERLHLIPVMFELGARPHPPQRLYRSYLAQSHVFLGIYWQRYGWVAPGEDVSGLEDEFRLSTDLPRLLYIKQPADGREPRLQELLDRLEADGSASYKRFTTPDELARYVEDDLAVLLTERFEATGHHAVDGHAPNRHLDTAPPVPLTRTIGRDREIDEVAGWLTGGARLLTVTGHGGTGKSRLALEVAQRVRAHYPDGVHLVSLEPVTDPTAVLRAVADRLGVLGEGRRAILDTLADRLAGWRTLLLLDNFEHVVAAGPDLAALLDRCPGVQAFVTSRQPLRLRGEREYPLAPLALPDVSGDDMGDSPAVQLFVERARSVRPDLEVTSDTLPVIAELVRRLDGLPLAIELAAARTRLLPPAALLDRLEERLDVLASGAVDLPERQRTLRATIDWSYQLLDPGEQQLLNRLSVFAGGATLEAAQAVCGDPDGPDLLETLSSLLEKSLLLSTTAAGGEPRVQMLYTVRAYAWERLNEQGELAAMSDRHADWFLGRAALVDPTRTPDAHGNFEDLLHEADDIHSAMDWVLRQGDVQRVAAFAGATWMWFWITGRVGHVRSWFEAAAPLADGNGASPQERAILLYALGQFREIMGDPVGSAEVMVPAVALMRELGHDQAVAGGLISLAAGAPIHSHPGEALVHARAALDIARRLGDDYLTGYASAIIGSALMREGDLAGSREAHGDALEAAERAAFVILEAQELGQLAMIDVLEGDLAHAWEGLRVSADKLRRFRNRECLGYWLETAAFAAHAEGDAETALRTLRRAECLREELELTIWPLLEPLHEQLVRDVEAAVGPEAAAAARDDATDPWALMRELLASHNAPHGPAVPA